MYKKQQPVANLGDRFERVIKNGERYKHKMGTYPYSDIKQKL